MDIEIKPKYARVRSGVTHIRNRSITVKVNSKVKEVVEIRKFSWSSIRW